MKSFEAKAFAKQLNLEDCLWEVARTGFQRHLLFGVKPLSLSPLSKLNCFPAKVHGISFIVCRYFINENVAGQLPHKSLLHLSAAEEMGTRIILKKSISDFFFPSQDQCWIWSFLHQCVLMWMTMMVMPEVENWIMPRMCFCRIECTLVSLPLDEQDTRIVVQETHSSFFHFSSASFFTQPRKI